MRTWFFFLLIVFAPAAGAQSISGVVKDDAAAPVAGASVALVKPTDTSVVKLALAGNDGSYSFQNITKGDYRISVTHVGYRPALSAPFSVNAAHVTAPALTLSKLTGDLKDITIAVRKPIVEAKADKMVVNVEGTINAAGSDALELLRKSPGVQVDKDENLSVLGKNGVQVYIDNRPTPLSGTDLSNYLKSLQSSQIEAIEIITNPSAKYEAAGNAGIINIRLKKNKAFGANGSATAGYAVGIFSRYNGSFNLNYRNKNVNIYGTYSASKGLNNNNLTLHRTVLDTLFDQKGNFVYDNHSHSLKLGVDYTLNKNASVGVLLNGNLADPNVTNTSRAAISYIPSGNVDRILVANNSSNLKRGNYNINLNYNYTGNNGKSLLINVDNGYYNNNNDQYQPNIYFAPDGSTLLRSVIYQMIAPTEIRINSGKIDYEQNFQGGKLGLGGKVSFVSTDNDFRRYNVLSSGNELDRDRSNRFTYNENISAAYANWNKAYKGFMIQAGLRVENTISEGTSTGEKRTGSNYAPSVTRMERAYLNFFPSAAVTFNKNPMNTWSLTYSRRIDRPAYQDLNPFEFKLDEYSFMKGNTDLRPQFTNSFGLTNVFKYRLTTTLNYSHVSDLFTQLIDTAERSKSFLIKKNLATQDIASLTVSYPFQYKSYSVFGNVNANYSLFKADFGQGRTIDLDAFGLTAFAQNSLRFAKTWTAEVTGFYNAPTIYQGTFKAKAMWGVDAGLQKQVLRGNGTIKASFSDVFRSMRFRATSEFAGQVTKVNARWEAQQFKLNFTLRFGSTTVKAAKQKSIGAEEEAKRAQQQSGGIGMGNNKP